MEIDKRIAIVRNNLRELVEQATARSGASDEELLSQRIAEQEAKLAVLRKQRDALAQSGRDRRYIRTATAQPAARATNDSSAITAIGGRGV